LLFATALLLIKNAALEAIFRKKIQAIGTRYRITLVDQMAPPAHPQREF